MSCCDSSIAGERFPGTGCCGSACAGGRSGCLASEPRIRSCMCQENVGCLDRADCGGFRPRGTAATGACPGPCQCVEEEAWNSNSPPKPNCEWLSNFSELRRQWSDHGKKNRCKCCSCAPTRRAVPCRPCPPPPKPCKSSPRTCTFDERLSGGACGGGSCDDQRSCPGPSTSGPCPPCSPAPKSILKPRNCCQCIGNYCMCQPMPRNCNCPPPPQVDARADRECSCDCPSSPECACPPSERRFPKTKVRCPNAKLCCPTPRAPPGPKCNCSKCQPCLPPPCDPCTATKCRPTVVKVAPCAPPPSCSPCTPPPACCPRPSSPPCATSRPQANRVSCMPPCRRPGQSAFHPTVYSRSTAFFNDNDREKKMAGTDSRPQVRGIKSQCRCGDDGRGCADDCQSCCSVNCAEDSPEMRRNETSRVQSRHNYSVDQQNGKQLRGKMSQSQCGDDDLALSDDCRYCCSVNCAEGSPEETKGADAGRGRELGMKRQCQCGTDGQGCAADCQSCCSVNCASDSPEMMRHEETTIRDQRRGQQLRRQKSQCQCGRDGLGCADDSRSCCSINCADTSHQLTKNEAVGTESQCNCSSDARGCAPDCHHCCSIECSSEINNDRRKRISAGSDSETTRRYSNEMGIIEKRNADESIESNSNTQHSQGSSQLRDLPVVRSSSASATLKRSTRLLQSLMRAKSSKAGVHHQDSNYGG